MNTSVIGIDTSKRVFHILGVTERGAQTLKKIEYRDSFIATMAQMPRATVVMESCGGSHHWGRKLKALGFDVKLIPPQYVKPYVKTNKHAWNDAQAICEAAQRPSMHFVEVKDISAQELQHIHRLRELAIKQMVATSDNIRGILLEYGIAIPQGKQAMRTLPERLEKAVEYTSLMRELITRQLARYWNLVEEVDWYDKKLASISKNHPVCQRLLKIRGVGPIIATGVVAKVTDPANFKNGRAFASSLGIVPKQQSSGGKAKLLGISKRGDRYLRKQLIHGARSLLYRCELQKDSMSRWAAELKKRRGWNRSAVAVANKTARIIWHVLRYESDYDVSKTTAVPVAA
jgi:transposase